jgi:thiamine-phosphate pyrophosphorylase
VHPRILRTIDANVNRISEGLRVLEDISRYIIEDADLSGRLKAIRHDVNLLFNQIESKLLETRDVEGAGLDLNRGHRDLASVARANAKRAQEGIRVLEELAKLPELKPLLSSAKLSELRYRVYSAEKAVIIRLTDHTLSGKEGKSVERKRKGIS